LTFIKVAGADAELTARSFDWLIVEPRRDERLGVVGLYNGPSYSARRDVEKGALVLIESASWCLESDDDWDEAVV
jgi:hypothetical protein